MKLTIKHPQNATIEVDGDQAECLAVLHSIFGFLPLGAITLTAPALTTTPWTTPLTPVQPYQPGTVQPWSPSQPTITIWGGGAMNEQPPFHDGELLLPYNPERSAGSTTDAGGYLVTVDGPEMKLTSLTQGQVMEKMGITFNQPMAVTQKTDSLWDKPFQTSGYITPAKESQDAL